MRPRRFETQRPPAFSPVDAAVETRPPAFSPVEAVAPVETPRPLPLDPRSPPDDDSDGDGDDAPPPWEDPRSPMRAKRDAATSSRPGPAGGAADAAQLARTEPRRGRGAADAAQLAHEPGGGL